MYRFACAKLRRDTLKPMTRHPAAACSTIPVFYREDMLAHIDSFSPSAGKPRLVLKAWLDGDLPIELRDFSRVTSDELALAHDPAYVTGVLSSKIPNGFGTTDPGVASTLPYTTGAMLAAARHALQHGVACAPVSGFHHAHYDSSGGFCTFNGLAVTACKLLAEQRVRRVLVLDCDQHFGDGTDDILGRLHLFESVENVTFGRWFHTAQDADRYLRKLNAILATIGDYDLILYQAGADVHVDDPLGGVLSTEQMRKRDELVFTAAKATRVPLAWNLAGGYQKPVSKVITLHLNTMQECVNAYVA